MMALYSNSRMTMEPSLSNLPNIDYLIRLNWHLTYVTFKISFTLRNSLLANSGKNNISKIILSPFDISFAYYHLDDFCNQLILITLSQNIQMDKDSSHYTNDDTPSYQDKSDKRQQLGTLNRTSPLHFALRINGHYYLSYEKNQFWMIVLRSVAWIVINIVIIQVINNLQNVSSTLKTIMTYGLIAQNILYIMLSFLDAGTVFEDQEDRYDEDRTLCMTCSVYRLRSTKHCIWCNKCVRKYDHHCSVFGKCIARRNLVIFYAFILVTGLQMPGLIITIISQLVENN